MSVFFFFFKQKTAYEIVMRLEFRRVLFRSPGGDGDRYDPFGAVTVTAGLLVAVYALSQAPQYGWGSARTISLMAVAAVLVFAFLVIETRVEAPLLPLRIFRLPTVAGANAVGLLLGGSFFGFIF